MTDQNNKIDNKDRGQVFFSWRFSEFDRHDRKQGWYIWSGIAIGFFLLYSVLTHNYIFGLIIIISALTIVMFQRSNNEVEFAITEDGLQVNDKFYEYRALSNFYIIYIPPSVKVLYIEPKSILSPRIPIRLEDQDPVKVRQVLLDYLDEDLDEDDEPLSEQTSRIFKL